MVSFIEKTDIYKIIVDPCRSVTWEGLFNFKPNAEDVATAIRKDIDELDPDDDYDDYDHDITQGLRQTLELVTFQTPELLGKVSIAGTYLGEISMVIIKVFAKEESSMMPVMDKRDSHLDGTGSIPLDDFVLRRGCMGPTEEDS